MPAQFGLHFIRTVLKHALMSDLKYENAIKDLCVPVIQTAHAFENGPKIDPVQIIFTYSPDEWEAFVHEWVHSLEKKYSRVIRPTGAGDKGIDVAGFTDAKKLLGIWDNYQCKRYANPLSFGNIAPEIGKMLWYSFRGDFIPPRHYYFVAPKGVSTEIDLLLANSDKLKTKIISEWDAKVSERITSTQKIKLDGKFLTHVNNFNFEIFSAFHPKDIVEQHRKTKFFIGRFGGGLPDRPKPEKPPTEIDEVESTYTAKLLDAYADHKSETSISISDLSKWKNLQDHFKRSREAFYHAESFRVFVRDKTEIGTFENLQEDIFLGVADVCDEDHADGFQRVKEVTKEAQRLSLDGNPLNKSSRPADRQGICHQLANDGRLTWKK